MTLELKPTDVQPGGFTENLNDDEWIAVNEQGHALSRASNEDGVKKAAPDAAGYFNGKQLRDGNKARNPFDHDGNGQPGGSLKRTAADGTVTKLAKAPDELSKSELQGAGSSDPLPPSQNASMNGGKTGSPENPASAEDHTPDPPLGNDGGNATDSGKAEDVAPTKGAALAQDPNPKAGQKSGGHKDDPGNTSRKASAGPAAKAPSKK